MHAALHRGLIHDLRKGAHALSEASKNRATELIIRLRSMLDQAWVPLILFNTTEWLPWYTRKDSIDNCYMGCYEPLGH